MGRTHGEIKCGTLQSGAFFDPSSDLLALLTPVWGRETSIIEMLLVRTIVPRIPSQHGL